MNVDFSPLFRSTVGFDHLFNMLDRAGQPTSQAAFPPYNIERTDENQYRISMAVAGFAEDELDIETKENSLVISGSHKEEKQQDENQILFHGIAARNFRRRFHLADHVEVQNASLQNGMLNIDLVRNLPEAMKTRKVDINGAKQIAN